MSHFQTQLWMLYIFIYANGHMEQIIRSITAVEGCVPNSYNWPWSTNSYLYSNIIKLYDREKTGPCHKGFTIWINIRKTIKERQQSGVRQYGQEYAIISGTRTGSPILCSTLVEVIGVYALSQQPLGHLCNSCHKHAHISANWAFTEAISSQPPLWLPKISSLNQ